MDDGDLITNVRVALKMSNDIEDTKKLQGLHLLGSILGKKNPRLSEYGYIEVIFKELNKLAKFESGELLVKIVILLSDHYSADEKYQDALMETFIYRYGLSNDREISLICLKEISSLIDRMGDNVAKHSKKIMQLADLGSPASLKHILIEILEKLETKLPERKR